MRISDWSSDVCSSDLVRHQAILFLPRAHPAVGRGTEQAVGSEATNAALHFLYRFPAIALAQHQAMRRDRQWRDDRRARGVGRLHLDVDELAKVVHVERRVDLPAARRRILDRKSTRLNSSH